MSSTVYSCALGAKRAHALQKSSRSTQSSGRTTHPDYNVDIHFKLQWNQPCYSSDNLLSFLFALTGGVLIQTYNACVLPKTPNRIQNPFLSQHPVPFQLPTHPGDARGRGQSAGPRKKARRVGVSDLLLPPRLIKQHSPTKI